MSRRTPRSPLILLFGCCVAHAALALASPDPWLAPNLTLVGLVLATASMPARWLALCVLAVGCVFVWAVRLPVAVAAGYLTAGWSVHWVAGQWDASDERVQGALVLGSSLLLTVGLLWLQELWSLPVAGLAVAHLALTYGAFVVVRRLTVNRLVFDGTSWTSVTAASRSAPRSRRQAVG